VQQIALLFDHLVGAREQRWRPSIIAVAKLMKSSDLVDCTTPSIIGAVFEALSAQFEAKRDRHEGCGCTGKLCASALHPQALRHQAMHALFGSSHLANAAIHSDAGKRVGIEPWQAFSFLQ
jgi:hypothetical protein